MDSRAASPFYARVGLHLKMCRGRSQRGAAASSTGANRIADADLGVAPRPAPVHRWTTGLQGGVCTAMRYLVTQEGQGATAGWVYACRCARRSPPMFYVTVLLVMLGLVAPPVAIAQADPGGSPQPVVVTFASADGSTFRTVLAQPADIAAVETALAGNGYAGIPNGALAYGDGGVNAPHGWHMEETALADVTIEVCDGTAAMVDADITYWVETVGRFCPWSATVLAIEPMAPSDGGTEDPDDEALEQLVQEIIAVLTRILADLVNEQSD